MLTVALTVRRALCVAAALTLAFATTGCQQWLAAGARTAGPSLATPSSPEAVRPEQDFLATLPVSPVIDYYLTEVEFDASESSPVMFIDSYPFAAQQPARRFVRIELPELAAVHEPAATWWIRVHSTHLWDFPSSGRFPDAAEHDVTLKFSTWHRENGVWVPRPFPHRFALTLQFHSGGTESDVVYRDNMQGDEVEMRVVRHYPSVPDWEFADNGSPPVPPQQYPQFPAGPPNPPHGTPGYVRLDVTGLGYPVPERYRLTNPTGVGYWGVFCLDPP